MKVFWSWQSDTPGRIGRHFVRETLEIAIEELKEEIQVEEPDREIHLDHDRKGVPGSPDLAKTILEKIKATSIFIADVTPVGNTPDKKALINSNVAIELGFALAHVGDHGILMVLNSHYGQREALPFDLKHKAGPIIFSLSPDASLEEIEKQRRSLSGTFKKAVRECFESLRKKDEERITEHAETNSIGNSAKYFEYGEALAERNYDKGVLRVTYRCGPILYLRLIPGLSVAPLKQHEAKAIACGIRIDPLNRSVGRGSSWERNRYGAITFSHETDTEGNKVFTTSQVFLNREIWGLDAIVLHGGEIIPVRRVEDLFEDALRHYLDVAESRLNLEPPLVVEAGAAEVANFQMVWRNDPLGRHPFERVYDNEIKSRHVLPSLKKEAVDKILLAIFEDFFDAVGATRPENYRDFPPKQEGQ